MFVINGIEQDSARQIFGALVFILGCCIGSFMNVVIWRLPRGEKLSYPGSHCPNCGHAIRFWENIPILSWLFLRGRCSGCHKPISIRYPLGESACGLLYVLFFWNELRRGLPLEVLPAQFFLAGALLAAAWIDVKHRLLPDKINYSGIVIALLLALLLPEGRHWLAGALQHPLRQHSTILCHFLQFCPMEPLRAKAVADALLGLLVGAGIPLLVGWAVGILLQATLGRKKGKRAVSSALGGGDVKFLGMLGAFFGADAVIYIILYGAVLGCLWALLSWPFRKRFPVALPFGPFLALTAALWMAFLS